VEGAERVDDCVGGAVDLWAFPKGMMMNDINELANCATSGRRNRQTRIQPSRSTKPVVITMAIVLFLVAGFAVWMLTGTDRLTSDQRRAVEAAMELMPHADRTVVEQRAESWGHTEMEKIHGMLLLKQNAPHLWHAANAENERIGELVRKGK
jgi:hypothetical protein